MIQDDRRGAAEKSSDRMTQNLKNQLGTVTEQRADHHDLVYVPLLVSECTRRQCRSRALVVDTIY
eukprot:183445-Hanusia_phi.AAC.1